MLQMYLIIVQQQKLPTYFNTSELLSYRKNTKINIVIVQRKEITKSMSVTHFEFIYKNATL